MYSRRAEQMMHTTHKDQMAFFCLTKVKDDINGDAFCYSFVFMLIGLNII